MDLKQDHPVVARLDIGRHSAPTEQHDREIPTTKCKNRTIQIHVTIDLVFKKKRKKTNKTKKKQQQQRQKPFLWKWTCMYINT